MTKQQDLIEAAGAILEASRVLLSQYGYNQEIARLERALSKFATQTPDAEGE